MHWFWITLLILTSAGIGARIARRVYGWALRNKGYIVIDGACVQCCKKMPGIVYNNTQSGGFVFCSNECVMCAHEEQRKAIEELSIAYDEERVLTKAERDSSDQIIKLQAAIIAKHDEVEASLNLQLSEKAAELRALEDTLNSLSRGASA